MPQNELLCAHCGAPHAPGLLACRYCRTPHSPGSARHALSCPHCGALNEDDNQTCAACSQWIVYKCLFCTAVSPCSETVCRRCKEPFAGAQERLRAREEAKRTQEQLQMASQVANAAAPVLGAVAGALFSGNGADDHDARSSRRRGHRERRGQEGGLLDGLFGGDSPAKSSSGGGILEELLRDTDSSDDGYERR